MTTTIIATAVEAVVKWGVPLLCGALGGAALAAIRRERRKVDAIGEGMRALLRAELVRAHREYYEGRKPIPLSVRTHLADVYAAYHDLDGNGSATKMWEDIMKCEVIA